VHVATDVTSDHRAQVVDEWDHRVPYRAGTLPQALRVKAGGRAGGTDGRGGVGRHQPVGRLRPGKRGLGVEQRLQPGGVADLACDRGAAEQFSEKSGPWLGWIVHSARTVAAATASELEKRGPMVSLQVDVEAQVGPVRERHQHLAVGIGERR
jgi:hypothetical protein